MSAKKLEQILFDIKAVQINTEKPFMLASGKQSPIYIDCRKLISSTEAMELIARKFKNLINKKIGPENAQVLAGGETAGIPFAAYLSAKIKMPMIYVRKAAKEHGGGKQIEGILNQGQKVVLVEDLITDGGSKLSFVEGIRNSGGVIENCLVVFDREQGGKEGLEQLNVKLHRLTTLGKTLKFGKKNNLISEQDYKTVKDYLKQK